MNLFGLRILSFTSVQTMFRSLKTLPEHIRAPLIQMSVVFGGLLAIGVWQTEFVFHAIMANVYLNSAIWSTFTFGLVLTYRNIFKMRNEALAFEALKELYADSRQLARGDATDPMWRYYRCNDLAVVFDKPEVLGQAYQLIADELSTGKNVQVSTATMQTMVESIQARLDERRSLTQYIAGILILLGLIGTFIGLMETLASVGKILGDLNINDSDTTAAIGTLLTNLQIPLRGMSTGFSSSLFGAIGSLVLSMMVRFSALAFSSFTQDFEEWLSNIVTIDEERSETDAVAPGVNSPMMEAKHLAQVLKAARISVSSNARVNAQLDELSSRMIELTQATQNQTGSVEILLGGMVELHDQGQLLSQAMARNLEALRQVQTGLDVKTEIVETSMSLQRQMQARDQSLSKTLVAVDQTLNGLRLQQEAASRTPSVQSKEAFDLLENIRASLAAGDWHSARDQLWAEDAAEPTAPERAPRYNAAAGE